MRALVFALSLLWASCACAQHTNPQLGDIWQYFGPTLGAGWGDNPTTSAIPNNTVLGNVSGVAAPAAALTATQATTLCNTFTSLLKGCVPASGGGTTNFLRADGTFAVPPGSGGISGSGTLNVIPRWTAPTVLGDSALSDNGTAITAVRPTAITVPLSTTGAELLSNPTFISNSTGWTFDASCTAWSSGQFNTTYDGVCDPVISADFLTTSGHVYQVVVTFTITGDDENTYTNNMTGGSIDPPPTQTYLGTATSTGTDTIYLDLNNYNNGAVRQVTGVSVKEVSWSAGPLTISDLDTSTILGIGTNGDITLAPRPGSYFHTFNLPSADPGGFDGRMWLADGVLMQAGFARPWLPPSASLLGGTGSAFQAVSIGTGLQLTSNTLSLNAACANLTDDGNGCKLAVSPTAIKAWDLVAFSADGDPLQMRTTNISGSFNVQSTAEIYWWSAANFGAQGSNRGSSSNAYYAALFGGNQTGDGGSALGATIKAFGGFATGTGGTADVAGGHGGSSGTTRRGGNVSLTGGNATSGVFKGGDVTITPGSGAGGGGTGNVIISTAGLPAVAAGTGKRFLCYDNATGIVSQGTGVTCN